jgi:hypothetical protein
MKQMIERPEYILLQEAINDFFNKTKKHITIMGSSGSGKTSLFRKLTYDKKFDITYINIREIISLPEMFLQSYLRRFSNDFNDDKSYKDLLINLDLLKSNKSVKNKHIALRDILLDVIHFPMSQKRQEKRIIILDDFESIVALHNFEGFENIAYDFINEPMKQSENLFIISLNIDSYNDIFWKAQIKKALKEWRIIESEPLNQELSQKLIRYFLDDADSNYIIALSHISEGNPAYIKHLCNSLKADSGFDTKRYDFELFVEILIRTLKNPDSYIFMYLNDVFKTSIARVRGNTSLLACLKILSNHDEIILKDISIELNRTPQAVGDYLTWLQKSGLVIKNGKCYSIRSTLLKFFILLNTIGDGELYSKIMKTTCDYFQIIKSYFEGENVIDKRKEILKDEIEIEHKKIIDKEFHLEFD